MMRTPLVLCAMLLAAFGVWWWMRSAEAAKSGDFGERRVSKARGKEGVESKDGISVLRKGEAARDYASELTKHRAVMDNLGWYDRFNDILVEWARVDPDAALGWALGQDEEGQIHVYYGKIVIEAVAAYDARKAMALVERMPDSRERGRVIEEIAGQLAKKDPEAALAYAREKNGDALELHRFLPVVEILARTNIGRALELLAEAEPEHIRKPVISSIVQEWSKRDFRAAFAWAEGLDAPEKMWAFEKIAPIWAQSHPEEALAYLKALPTAGGGGRIDAIRDTLKSWAAIDPAAALKWVGDAPTADQASMTSAVYEGWVKSKPEEAVEFASGMNDIGLRDSILREAMVQLRGNSPEKAAKLVPHIADEEKRHMESNTLIHEWVKVSPQAAEAWVSSLEEGKLKELAIASLIVNAGGNDPDLGAEWLGKVADADQRLDLIEWVGKEWLYVDEEKGRRRLTDLGLPEGAIELLKKKIYEKQADPFSDGGSLEPPETLGEWLKRNTGGE
jgi:hypothetical protein